jgi:hypothetical protein
MGVHTVGHVQALNFVADLVGRYPVGPENTRWGAIVFADNVEQSFPIGQYTNEQDTQNAFIGLHHFTGHTNITAYVRECA